MRSRWARRAAVLAGGRCRRRARRHRAAASRRDEGHDAGGLGQHHLRRGLDRRRGRSLRRRDQGVQQAVPERQGQLQAGRRQPADGALDRGRRRQAARHGRHRPARARQAVRRQGRAEADHLRAAGCCARTSRRRGSRSARSTGKIYGLVFKASNKSTVWYNVRRSRTRASSRRRPGRSSPRPRTRSRPRARPPYSIGGADGWTLTDLFENIYLRQAGPAKYALLAAHKIKWTDPSVTAALKTMAPGVRQLGEHGRRHVRRRPDRLPDLGQQRLPEPAEGGDGDRGRLRPGRRDREGEAGTGYGEFPFPSINGSAAVGRDRRRHDRRVQGHARRSRRS